MSYHSAPAQRVPAWKRLGLKLKGAASGESLAPEISANATANTSASSQHQSSPGTASGIKRKQPSTSATAGRGPTLAQDSNKRQRTDTLNSSPRTQKTVSFTEDTKPSAEPREKTKKPAKKSKPKKKATSVTEKPAEVFNLEPSLLYLRHWKSDRGSWKFNKNHQTLLIKACLEGSKIPAADVSTFLEYIRDLKGFIRMRLQDQAEQIKKQDMEQGSAGFIQTKEKEDKESKQELYEEVLTKLLQLGQHEQGSSTVNANGKRSFDEVEFTARDMDVEVRQRVIKRMRAELVLQELSDSEESTTSTSTAAASTDDTNGPPSSQGEPAESVREKRAKLNDGSQQKVKRRRVRNARTADISDDDSSSESDSDSESDSSSSSSSSDDSEDEDMPLANGQDRVETSSSSSSSSDDSDSGSGSGAGDDSDEGSEEDSDDE